MCIVCLVFGLGLDVSVRLCAFEVYVFMSTNLWFVCIVRYLRTVNICSKRGCFPGWYPEYPASAFVVRSVFVFCFCYGVSSQALVLDKTNTQISAN